MRIQLEALVHVVMSCRLPEEFALPEDRQANVSSQMLCAHCFYNYLFVVTIYSNQMSLPVSAFPLIVLVNGYTISAMRAWVIIRSKITDADLSCGGEYNRDHESNTTSRGVVPKMLRTAVLCNLTDFNLVGVITQSSLVSLDGLTFDRLILANAWKCVV